MSNSTNHLVENLKITTVWINRIIPPLHIGFGTFGNLFNIIIFTRRNLRTSPCATYFLVSSINNMFVLYVALLTYYLAASWQLDLSATDTAVCKIRAFFVYSSLCLTLWLTVLTSIDRFLSSSENVRLRQMSSLGTARKLIASTTIFIYLIHAHILIFFQLYVRGNSMACGSLANAYSIFMNFFVLTTASLLPIILTSIFGILMIINVRKIRNRVGHQAENIRNEHSRSHDHQLIKMVLFQVLITILITAPYSILSTYRIIAVTILKITLSASEQAIISWTLNLFLLFYYANPAVGFYVYTLTGSKFRFEVKRCSRYGLKLVLTATGLVRCLPLRTQQALLVQNQMDTANAPTMSRRAENGIYSLQYRKPRNMTSAV